jgi:hypothetical protein
MVQVAEMKVVGDEERAVRKEVLYGMMQAGGVKLLGGVMALGGGLRQVMKVQTFPRKRWVEDLIWVLKEMSLVVAITLNK